MPGNPVIGGWVVELGEEQGLPLAVIEGAGALHVLGGAVHLNAGQVLQAGFGQVFRPLLGQRSCRGQKECNEDADPSGSLSSRSRSGWDRCVDYAPQTAHRDPPARSEARLCLAFWA